MSENIGLLSAYKGLKLSFQKGLGANPPGLLSAYKGLKLYIDIILPPSLSSLLSAYKGLKHKVMYRK